MSELCDSQRKFRDVAETKEPGKTWRGVKEEYQAEVGLQKSPKRVFLQGRDQPQVLLRA